MDIKRFLSFSYMYKVVIFLAVSLFGTNTFAETDTDPVTGKTIPFTRLETGQYLINVMIDQKGPFVFMIDTAATRSCIFEKTYKKLNSEEIPDAKALIRGMTSSRIRPMTKLSSISFAGQSFADHNVVILKDWEDQHEQLDGILGIELLQNMVMSFSHKYKRVRIRDKFNPKALKFRGWRQVKLIPNPYPGEDFGLMFTGSQIGKTVIPTVLDTGSNFTTINWVSVKGTSLEKEKTRLRDEWVVQGAVGEFKPSLVVKLDKLIVGGIELQKHELLLMDLDDFPVNGHGKFPLIIAGIDLMGGRDFVLDLKEKILFVEPSRKALSVRPNASRIEHRGGL